MSGFLQPLLLWGLALASVPIIIHLLNRRRYTTVRWAAMEFLRAAYRKNQRRLRFENLLLLLVRTALIVLLVLAAARPLLTGRAAAAFTDEAVNLTLVLDNSYSMGFNEGVTRPFDRALEEAGRIVGSLSAEDTITVYLVSDNFQGARPGVPRAIVRESRNPEAVRALLPRITVSSARSTMAETLAVIADQLDERKPGKEVVILTDLQRAAFETAAAAGRAPGDGAAPDGPTTIVGFLESIAGKGAAIHVIDVGAKSPDNAAILDFGPSSGHPLVAGSDETFTARLVNYGRQVVRADVRFSVDGRHKGAAPVEIPPARAVGEPGETIARFQFPDLPTGAHVFSAELAADGLPIDDVRLFAGEVRELVRVLAVDGDPDGNPSETFYLKPAIALLDDRIETQAIDPLEFVNHDVTRYDLVILANVDRIREEQAARLKEFVAAGGGLVIFTGDKIDPESANRMLGAGGAGLMPGVLGDEPVLVTPESRRTISLDAPPHPLLSRVLGPEADPEGLWEAPRVWGWYPIEVPADDPAVSVLLRLTDPAGSPALVEKRFGRGRVLLFATTADLAWGDLPSTFVMPVLWHEMVYYLAAGDPTQANLLPFATYSRELPKRAERVQTTTPDGGRVQHQVPPAEEGGAPRFTFEDTEAPGRYLVQTSIRGEGAIDAGTQSAVHAFAVNVDAREGDLRRMAPEELAAKLPGGQLVVGPTWDRIAAEAAAEPEGEISRAVLLAVLLFLFVEIFLARRFGDAARRPAAPEATT